MNIDRLRSARTGLLACVLIIIAGAGSIAQAEPRQPPGSRIAMDLPKEFEFAKLFSGFVFPGAGISVVLTELAGAPYDKVVAGMTDAALAKRGFSNIVRGKLKRNDTYTYFTADQAARGQTFRKYVLVIHDARGVGVITLNAPLTSETGGFMKDQEIRTALAGAALKEKTAPIIKQFTIGQPGPFKEAGKLMGSAVLYSTDGRLAPPKPGQTRSVLIVAPSVDRLPVDDAGELSKQALRALGGYRDLKMAATETVTVGGLTGSKLQATAISTSDNVSVNLSQIILPREGGGYFRLLAVIKEAESAKLSEAAATFFESFTPTSK